MRARQHTSITSNRSTGQKRAVVNYAEQGNQDSGHDSDYEAKLIPPQPLDNKSYPSASRIATQHVIETNRASKQTSTPNTCSLPAATEPAQGSVQINKQTEDNKVLSEATTDLNALTIPDKTAGKTPGWTRQNNNTTKERVTRCNKHVVTRTQPKTIWVNPNAVQTSLSLAIQ